MDRDEGTGPPGGDDRVDPDAPWKRDYRGPAPKRPRHVERTPARPDGECTPDPWSREAVGRTVTWVSARAGRTDAEDASGAPLVVPVGVRSAERRDVAVAGVGVLAALVVASLIAVAVVRRPVDPALACRQAHCAPLVPREVGDRWVLEVEPETPRDIHISSGAGRLAVLADDTLRVHDLDGGALVWSHALGDSLRQPPRSVVSIAADVVMLIQESSPGRFTDLVAFDAETGAERWRHTAGEGANLGAFEEWVYEFVGGPFTSRLQMLDPTTGEPLGDPLQLAGIAAVQPFLVTEGDGRARVVDIHVGEPLGPWVDVADLQALTWIGDAPVGFDDDDNVVLFGAEGERVDHLAIETRAFAGGLTGPPELIGGIPGSDLGIVASGVSTGFRVDRDTIDTLWEVDGRVSGPDLTSIGLVSVVRQFDTVTRKIDVNLLDVATGTVIAMTDSGLNRLEEPTVGYDGYLVGPALGATPTVGAIGYDGEPWWTIAIPADASYVLADGHLVVVDRNVFTTTVTVYG